MEWAGILSVGSGWDTSAAPNKLVVVVSQWVFMAEVMTLAESTLRKNSQAPMC
jgi:hypothetical protein